MSRKISKIQTQLELPDCGPDPLAALETQAASGAFTYLLAYAEDGILWGKVVDNQLLTPDKLGFFASTSPRLRLETLQEAHLFGKDAEYLLWRDGAAFKARLVRDGSGPEVDCYDEALILWGTDEAGPPQDGFYPVREADMGIRHTPPLNLAGRHSLRLVVRHYLQDDDAGAAFVYLSRLVDLTLGA